MATVPWTFIYFMLLIFFLQIFIFYGSRSNAELLIHNGFVYLPSRCDRMSLKLGNIRQLLVIPKLVRQILKSFKSFYLA